MAGAIGLDDFGGLTLSEMQMRYEGYFQMLLFQSEYTSMRINHFIANSFSDKPQPFDFQSYVTDSLIQIEFPKDKKKKKKKKKFKVPDLDLDGL